MDETKSSNDRLRSRPVHYPLYCSVCGIIGADTIGWAYPAHGRPEEGMRAPMHKRCLTGRRDDDQGELPE